MLAAHPGLALVAIYNRNDNVKGRTLFLLDGVARLSYLRILETARNAGRKYGIMLITGNNATSAPTIGGAR